MRQGSEEKRPVIPLNPDPAVFAAPSTFLEVKPALHSAQYGSDAYHGPPASDSGTVRIAAKKLDRLIIGSDNLLSTRLFLTHRMQELEEMISRFSLWRWNHSVVLNDCILSGMPCSGRTGHLSRETGGRMFIILPIFQGL